ncbi:MAG: amidohydrolase [Defluviitaleaceae bacterium]|nr:amidohydrolase [Defluviitaleaceae bacterium]
MKKSMFLILILAIITASGRVTPLPSVKADLYFENGVIYTADAADTVAEALAVKDGIIIFVGSAEEGRAYRSGAAEIIDLHGGMLLPGFIDGHIHTITFDFFDFIHFADANPEQVLKTAADYIIANPDQDRYFGFGFNVAVFDGEEAVKGPMKERLDEICPDKPVFIYAMDGHAVWLNSKAFEYSGITADTVSPPGGEIVKDADGGLWGTVLNTAISLLPDFFPAEEKLKSALMDFQYMLNSLGYTSIMTIPAEGYADVPWEGYHDLEQEGLLNLRVRGHAILRHWNLGVDLYRIQMLSETYNSGMLKLIGAKVFVDGIIGNETAYLLDQYSSTPGNYGTANWTRDDLNRAFATVNQMGLQVHAHTVGDAAVRMALGAAEYASNSVPGVDFRNSFTHLMLVNEADIPRFAELSIIPIPQTYWHFKQPGAWEPIEYPAIGQRAEKLYPLNSFIQSGANPVFSSDYPSTTVPLPFYAIEIAVTRNLPDAATYGVPYDITDIDDPRYLLWPEERIEIKDAIRAFTINAAYAIFSEDVTGSLEVGKSADLIVTDQDLFSVDPLRISDTRVLRTYFNGRLVHLMND